MSAEHKANILETRPVQHARINVGWLHIHKSECERVAWEEVKEELKKKGK